MSIDIRLMTSQSFTLSSKSPRLFSQFPTCPCVSWAAEETGLDNALTENCRSPTLYTCKTINRYLHSNKSVPKQFNIEVHFSPQQILLVPLLDKFINYIWLNLHIKCMFTDCHTGKQFFSIQVVWPIYQVQQALQFMINIKDFSQVPKYEIWKNQQSKFKYLEQIMQFNG